MTHAPDDVLAAIALGDDADVDADMRAHVQDCPVCSLEVAELAHVDGLLHEETGMRGAHRIEPGPQVWERIVAHTTSDTNAEPDAHTQTSTQPPVDLGARRHRHASTPGQEGPPDRRRAGWLVAAAAACVLAGALLGRALWSAGDDSSSQVVASTALTTLDASRQREGTAELLDLRGTQELRVQAQSMPTGGGYVEVWLINADGKRMVSLGVMSTAQAVFPVPPDAIAQGYTIVDLSREQYDDKPQHSGDSIMRGTLPA